MTDVKCPTTITTMSPITTTAPTSKRADMLKQPYTILQSKLQRGRQLIERNSIKDRTMAIFWAEMENVIMQILDIIADMFDSCTPLNDITPVSPSASLDVIAILSISNKFSQLTRSFVQLVSDNDAAIHWRQCNYRRWAGSKRTQEQQQQRHVIQSIVDLVRKESNIMLEQLQLLRDFVSQHGRMYSQHTEKHRTTAESIQHLLISHANNLVDTLVAFFKSPAFITLVNKLELAINQQQQQRFLDNNSSTMLVLVQDAVVGYDMTRDTEAHQNHDDQQEDTVGRRFFRSISSFKSEPASTMTSVAPNSTMAIADACLFDSHHPHTSDEHLLRSSLSNALQQQQHRPPTPNDVPHESTPKNGLKLLFSNRWGSHTPTPKKSRSLKDMFYTQLSNASLSSHKQRKGSQDASIYDNESATLETVSGYWSCSASVKEKDDSINGHVGPLSGVKAGELTLSHLQPTSHETTMSKQHQQQPSYQPNHDDAISSLPSPPPSAKYVSKPYYYHHHHPPPLARVPRSYHQDPMPPSSSDDALAVSASESSIRNDFEMDSSYQPSSNNNLSISTSHPTGLTIDHQDTSRLPRSPSTLSAIHTEHAQPTFVSSQSRTHDNPHVIPEHVNQQQQPSHLAVPPPPSSMGGPTRTLKHFRSESDLARLKNVFTPTSAKARAAHDRHPRCHPQQQSNTGLSSARMSPSGSNSTTSSNSVKTLVPQRTSSLRSSTSTITMNSANDKDSNAGENHSWGLLRSLRKNYSSVNLRQAAKEESLRETSLDTTSLYGYPLGKNMPPSRHDSTIHISENGQDVLIMESVCGKTEVVAGTQERLFARLADEGVQDLDYVDTYILNHSKFTSSADLLENLMARFHMETLPDSQHYSKRCIQVKILNVISRWVKLQYSDFKKKGILQTRLEAFLNGDVKRAGFSTEAKMIKDALNLQISKHSRRRHSLLAMSSHSLTSFGSNNSISRGATPTCMSPSSQRRTSPTMSIFSFGQQSSQQQSNNITTPPTSPMSPIYKTSHDDTTSILLSTDSKYIARYLTLADFYLLKCITGYDYLNGLWRRPQKEDDHAHDGCCYIDLMTQRANMLTHWIMHELLSIKGNKQRRTGLRRVIDIAKHCVEWNNYHTAMVITMGLASTPVQRMQDTWESLSSRDMNAYMSLQRLLDVSNNMSHYRQAFSKKVAKKQAAPAVPFFPLILKDLTFYMDGTPTMKQPMAGNVPLINFVKFRAVTKFVQGILSHTHENYWFAGELDHLAFFPGMHPNEATFSSSAAGPLDPVAEAIEYRLRSVVDCYNDTGCHAYSHCT